MIKFTRLYNDVESTRNEKKFQKKKKVNTMRGKIYEDNVFFSSFATTILFVTFAKKKSYKASLAIKFRKMVFKKTSHSFSYCQRLLGLRL